MLNLTDHDLYWCRARLPKALRELMRFCGPRVIVAGGYVRSCITHEPISDIDVFTPSPEAAFIVSHHLAKLLRKGVHITPNAFTVKCRPSIQFISRWTFDTPAALLASFDFTIARGAIWYNEDGSAMQSQCDERFYADLAAHRLVYCSPIREEEPGGSLLRVLKFYQRGYRTPLDSLGAVIGRLLKGVDPANWGKRQTMDAEQWSQQIGQLVTGLLREVDPEIDPDHVAHDPSMAEVVNEFPGF